MAELGALGRETQALLAELDNYTEEEVAEVLSGLPEPVVEAFLNRVEIMVGGESDVLPTSPLEQARALVDDFADRPHLTYLSERIAQALRAVDQGHDRRIIIQMPPRSGKSLLATQITGAWALSTHPHWPVVLTSYSGPLATSWGRQIRRWTSDGKLGNHLRIAPDAGAATDWDTLQGGSMHSRSIGGGITGYGAKMLVIDDPHKDFADAHSPAKRDAVWDWWLSTASLRLNPPSLVIVIMTRWHEDDLAGRLLSKEYAGDPAEWEVIRFPAIAEEGDVLGRTAGDPLYSPLLVESREQAIERWEKVKGGVGTYVWSAMFQQRPAPPQGAIFDVGWWKYWTNDPGQADGERIIYLDPATELAGATWLDSWDLTFKGGTDKGDFVVGQRWARSGASRYLIGQQRGRWTFTEQIDAVRRWAEPSSVGGTGRFVHKRIVEDAANGPALIDTLKREIAGIKPIRPRGSKENRARAVTPEIEAGNIYLPHPTMDGCAWVTEFVSEFRNFPNDAHDDQVDTASQALYELRDSGSGGITMPGESNRMTGLAQPGGFGGPRGYGHVGGDRVASARTMDRRA